MTFTNRAMLFRREIYKHICNLVFKKEDVREFDRIPIAMRPRKGVSVRCCIHKDRAVLRYKIMAMFGFNFYEETDELKSLGDYALEALEGKRENKQTLSVVDEACSACIRKNYLVTNACRGCVARPCQVNCPKEAIHFKEGRAYIDADDCVNCGKCLMACPYHAIIYQPVPCEEVCPVDAIQKDEDGNERIDEEKCIHCGKCLVACPFGAIVERSDLLTVVDGLSKGKKYTALIAPSIIGQYNNDLSSVIDGLKKVGFHQVYEVAQGAEITSEKEAEELSDVLEKDQFLTTSCCPSYVELVQKHIPDLVPHISHTKSPMYYTAELAKRENSAAETVFIGPCVAKRNEAEQYDCIDQVLSFEELGALFVAKGIDVSTTTNEASKDIADLARGFAFSGGVAKSVLSRFEHATIRWDHIEGMSKANVRRLKRIKKEKLNFLEVMVCEGGCAAGPTTIANPKLVKKRHSAICG